MKRFFVIVLNGLIIIFLCITIPYVIDEVILRNHLSTTIIIQQNLSGISRGSRMKIISSGTLLINNKIPTEKQWETIIKQTTEK
jgi:hypothetical protein